MEENPSKYERSPTGLILEPDEYQTILLGKKFNKSETVASPLKCGKITCYEVSYFQKTYFMPFRQISIFNFSEEYNRR